MDTIDTWLPIFPGFYNTVFSSDATEEAEICHINQEREEKGWKPVEWEHCDFDTEQWEEDVAKAAVKAIKENLKDFVSDIRLQNISSPKEYNFANDTINIEADLSEKNKKDIMKFLKDNYDDFKTHIADHYTSCDGFISHYSRYVDDWLDDKELLFHDHKLGRVLEFICEMGEMDMYDIPMDDVYLSVKNYDRLVNKKYRRAL